MKQVTSLLVFVFVAAFVSGCGFTLRNDFQVDSQFRQMRVLDATAASPLTKVLTKRLHVYQVEVVNRTTPDIHQQLKVPTIFVLPEKMDRRLLSLFPSGQVAEYELLYFCRYQVQMPSGEARDFEFQLSREYQDDPDQVLAKSRELDLILSEMRQLASDRIVSQLRKL